MDFQALIEALDTLVGSGRSIVPSEEFEQICAHHHIDADSSEAADFCMERGWRYAWFVGNFFYSATYDTRLPSSGENNVGHV